MAQRHVNGRAQATTFFTRRHQCGALFNRNTQRCTEFGVQYGSSMLELTGLTDDGCLAVAVRLAGFYAQGLDTALT